jgi:hypothetical protein
MTRLRDEAIGLYIRNKRQAGMTAFAPDKFLLFVHGTAYLAETAFDWALNGLSMMDYLAQEGFDVYLVDVRGQRQGQPPCALCTALDLLRR